MSVRTCACQARRLLDECETHVVATNHQTLRILLLSYNYVPEPTGIGPISHVAACGLRDLGHEVQVISAHPHYPEAKWGIRALPYRQRIDGIPVLRLPLWTGRDSAAQRYRQEVTYAVTQALALASRCHRPDVVLCVSPSFPALLPVILLGPLKFHRWVLWLQDLLPDGAKASGLLDDGLLLSLALRLERASYSSAQGIVVPAKNFADRLTEKHVSPSKISIVRNPATRRSQFPPSQIPNQALRILCMGNIGYSQGLARLVRAFESCGSFDGEVAQLVITGTGVEAQAVAESITSDRIEMLGLVADDVLDRELAKADIGLVSQNHVGPEFNIPSKIANYMISGLPVLAVVNPRSEVARVVHESGGGWVIDAAQPDLLPGKIHSLATNRNEVLRRGHSAHDFAVTHFAPRELAHRLDIALHSILN